MRRLIFIILGLLSFSHCVNAQEQVSTWSFADNIGWKGLELSYNIYGGSQPYFKDIRDLEKYVDATSWVNSPVTIPNPLTLFTFPTFYKSLSIHAVFVPFREAKSRYISKMEWHSGLEFQFGSPGTYFELNGQPYKIRFHQRNLMFNNKLFLEQRISKNLKLYGGPNFKLSLVPVESLEIAEFDNERNRKAGFGIKYDPVVSFNQTLFSMGGGLSLGFKLNLSCRFNINFEYQYQYLYRYMQVGKLNTTYSGGSVGIRYKFIKPDPNDKEITSPFW